MGDPARFERAVSDGLKDPDPMVRRYALVALDAKDPERAKAEAKALLTDSSPAVRKVAKMLCRQGGLYRENIARSVDPLFDHAVTALKRIHVKGGKFKLAAALAPETWVEIGFGKPKEDLYVWLNGIYLGCHDLGPSGWNVPFSLDCTKEIRWGRENILAVRILDTAGDGGIYKPIEIEILK